MNFLKYLFLGMTFVQSMQETGFCAGEDGENTDQKLFLPYKEQTLEACWDNNAFEAMSEEEKKKVRKSNVEINALYTLPKVLSSSPS